MCLIYLVWTVSHRSKVVLSPSTDFPRRQNQGINTCTHDLTRASTWVRRIVIMKRFIESRMIQNARTWRSTWACRRKHSPRVGKSQVSDESASVALNAKCLSATVVHCHSTISRTRLLITTSLDCQKMLFHHGFCSTNHPLSQVHSTPAAVTAVSHLQKLRTRQLKPISLRSVCARIRIKWGWITRAKWLWRTSDLMKKGSKRVVVHSSLTSNTPWNSTLCYPVV